MSLAEQQITKWHEEGTTAFFRPAQLPLHLWNSHDVRTGRAKPNVEAEGLEQRECALHPGPHALYASKEWSATEARLVARLADCAPHCVICTKPTGRDAWWCKACAAKSNRESVWGLLITTTMQCYQCEQPAAVRHKERCLKCTERPLDKLRLHELEFLVQPYCLLYGGEDGKTLDTHGEWLPLLGPGRTFREGTPWELTPDTTGVALWPYGYCPDCYLTRATQSPGIEATGRLQLHQGVAHFTIRPEAPRLEAVPDYAEEDGQTQSDALPSA